jgi:HlyD family secretion protein
MDIQRPGAARARKIRRIIYGSVTLVVLVGITLGLRQLHPAAPSVDAGIIWRGTVKRGPMVLQVRGLGTLVPEDIRWVASVTDGRVDKILLRSGAIVKPDTIILELTNPDLERQVVDAEMQLKKSEAEMANLRVQLDSALMTQKAGAAQLEEDFTEAKLQAERDDALLKLGLVPDLTARISRARAVSLSTRHELEQQRLSVADKANQAQIAAKQAEVEQNRALYELRKKQREALHVRAGIAGVLQCVCSVAGGPDVNQGQQVTAGTNLARVADPLRLKAVVQIAETQANTVAPGQMALVDTRTGTNSVVRGHVSRIDAAAINGTVGVEVTIDEPLPQGARPDQSVDGTIQTANLKDVLYVERPVHGQQDATVGLFKVVENGNFAIRVTVKLGRSSVNTIEVLSGLNVGDVVLLNDMSQFDNVDRVQIK